MKESYEVRPSQSPWPRVMRCVGQLAHRSDHKGTTGLCIELHCICFRAGGGGGRDAEKGLGLGQVFLFADMSVAGG